MELPGVPFLRRAVAFARARAGAAVSAHREQARRASVERAGELSPEAFTEILGLPRSPEAAWTEIEKRASPPLLPDPSRSALLLRERLPGSIPPLLEDARLAREHVFDLLGSGPRRVGEQAIDWHLDWKTGVRWPTRFYQEIPVKPTPSGPEDVKMPWELSRFYHASALGRAFALTRDESHARELRAQIEHWLAANPYARSCNWMNAMEVALRAVGWLLALDLARGSAALDPAFRLEVLRSLYLHARFIARNLEVYGTVTSNHYLSDGVGLLLIGHALPENDEVRAWRKLGETIAIGQMAVQVRADGVDYENAVSYHRLVLELFLLAFLRLRRSGRGPGREFEERLEAMFRYVLSYTRPDGTSPLVGDADDGRAFVLGPLRPHDDHRYLLAIGAAILRSPSLKKGAGVLAEPLVWLLGEDGVGAWDALDAASAPEPASARFEPSRVAILRHGGAHAFFDAGDVGISGKGSHGHDDALSLELTLGGEAFVRDAGPFVYTADPKRRFLARSIRSHNVVVVDGAEASGLREDVLWNTPEEQEAALETFEASERLDLVSGRHEGYSRLPSPVLHRRRLALLKPEDGFLVHDRLEGQGEHVFRWQALTPFLEAQVVGLDTPGPSPAADLLEAARVRVSGLPEGTRRVARFRVQGARAKLDVLVLATAPAEGSVEVAPISPSYGVEREARRLVVLARAKAHLEIVSAFAAAP